MTEFATPQFDENAHPIFDDADIPTTNDVVAMAQEIILRGVIARHLDPRNPVNQVLVAGATFIMACATSGISPEDAYSRLSGESVAPAGTRYEPQGYL